MHSVALEKVKISYNGRFHKHFNEIKTFSASKNPGENNPFLSFVLCIYLVDHSLGPNDHFQLARPLIEF